MSLFKQNPPNYNFANILGKSDNKGLQKFFEMISG
jgi:hypothetical protein